MLFGIFQRKNTKELASKEFKNFVKPNGLQSGVFRISINDGYCEYSFDMKIEEDRIIIKIYEKFRNSVNAPESKGTLRWSCMDDKSCNLFPTK